VKSQIVKRSIVIAGRKTSISLEDAFWRGLREIAARRATRLSDLVAEIDSTREDGSNLSSTVRLFVLDFYLGQLTGEDAETRLGTVTSKNRWVW
jgi:predicted DNA-binding ribbon-helix-helix protein